jgi:tRNA A-37 threonylcarbamoyl transferase component Bud32
MILSRHGALECLKKLHLAGLGHGDVLPHNFGARNGEMVILDFSQASPCELLNPSKTHDSCYEVQKLRETLFGDEET